MACACLAIRSLTSGGMLANQVVPGFSTLKLQKGFQVDLQITVMLRL